jgi:NADP-dependent 3-hydroxy acid dehydrogenase YdfG
MDYSDKVIWITGGGSGIGRALAHEYADMGATVAISGRRAHRLEEVADELEETAGSGLPAQCDVTEEQQVRSTVSEIVEETGRLDAAIANAGFAVAGEIEELTADDWRRQFDVNVVGAITTVKESLPYLEETDGRAALMGSVAGTIPMPGNGPYHASKYAIRCIGQTLSMELADSEVSCTTVQPGFVDSEIYKVDNEGDHHDDWEDRRPTDLVWPTDRAARVIVRAIHRRKKEFTFTGHGRVAAFFGKHFPGMTQFLVKQFG